MQGVAQQHRRNRPSGDQARTIRIPMHLLEMLKKIVRARDEEDFSDDDARSGFASSARRTRAPACASARTSAARWKRSASRSRRREVYQADRRKGAALGAFISPYRS